MKEVVIHTDGGCRPNPGVGAWAVILQHGAHTKELVGGAMETTNNRMEMLAAINGLEALKEPCRVRLHTDSIYLRDGITKWIHNWRKKGWKTSAKEPVKNQDLWIRLDEALKRHQVTWEWVRGHADNALNNRCDELCTAEIDRLDRKR